MYNSFGIFFRPGLNSANNKFEFEFKNLKSHYNNPVLLLEWRIRNHQYGRLYEFKTWADYFNYENIILIIILWNLTFLRIFVYEKLHLNFHKRTFFDELYILIYIHYNSFSFIYSKKMYENKWVCDLVGLRSHQVDVFWILIWVYDSFLETFESDHWVLNSINF